METKSREVSVENEQKRKNQEGSLPIAEVKKKEVTIPWTPKIWRSGGKLDVSSLPEAPTLEQYEQVPVEEYGLAMLRKMGWKPGEGIGKKKQVVKPIESVLRPKGLGLGADPKLVEKMKSEALKCDGEEGLSYVKGGFIKVESGPHRNLYGEIEGIDEDNSRIMVRLTLSDKVVTLSRFVVCLVTMKEYKREAKILKMEAKLESLLERCLASETECEKLRKKYDDSLAAIQDLERENQTLQMEIQKHLTRKCLEDSEVDSCTNCPKIFSVTVRKHHCQNCGKIFCHECSSKQATVASSKKPVRVCDTCFKEVLNH